MSATWTLSWTTIAWANALWIGPGNSYDYGGNVQNWKIADSGDLPGLKLTGFSFTLGTAQAVDVAVQVWQGGSGPQGGSDTGVGVVIPAGQTTASWSGSLGLPAPLLAFRMIGDPSVVSSAFSAALTLDAPSGGGGGGASPPQGFEPGGGAGPR